ncbi:MAG TPA: DNA repair protein RadC [Rhabdochlamydiaceae bacterium]|jgi:DNA repair protein RadC
MQLKSLPQSERPRERLLQQGPDALSLAELLAIVLCNGTQGKSVLDLAQEVLGHFGSVENLFDASIAELMLIKGIGQAKAIQLKAIFGIVLKCQKLTSHAAPIISCEEAYRIAKAEIEHCKQEVLLVLLRDVKGCLIHREHVAVGTLSEVLAHPREIFYPAVRHKAHSFILAHNHPSGDPTPSNADLELTRCLIHSSKVMGIGLDDHLIIGREKYVSLRAQGYLETKAKY